MAISSFSLNTSIKLFLQNDLKEAFPTLASNLEKLLLFEGDVEEVFSLNFVVTYDYFGEMRTHELKPNGANIPVTNDNRKGNKLIYWVFIKNKQYLISFLFFS